MTYVLISSADAFPEPMTAKASGKTKAKRGVDVNMIFLLRMRAQCGMWRQGINGPLTFSRPSTSLNRR